MQEMYERFSGHEYRREIDQEIDAVSLGSVDGIRDKSNSRSKSKKRRDRKDRSRRKPSPMDQHEKKKHGEKYHWLSREYMVALIKKRAGKLTNFVKASP